MGVDVQKFEALLKKQDQVFTREQALALGFTRYDVRARLTAGPWQKLFPGVYLAHAFPPTHDQWCRAALLYCGPNARLAGSTAARLHGLWGFTPVPDKLDVPMLPIEVAVPHTQQFKADHLSTWRYRSLEPGDLTTRLGFATFKRVPTLIQIASDATQQQLAMAYGDVLRQGQYDFLRRRLAEMKPGRAGLERLEELVLQFTPAVGAVKSPLEAWCADVMRRADLWPRRQWLVEYGGKRCVLDFAFTDVMLAIETDGRKVHAGDPYFDNDRVRWNWLENRGWSQLRFTWRQMYDEAYVIGTIRERLVSLYKRLVPPASAVVQ